MGFMALRKHSDTDAVDDDAPLSKPEFPMVVPAGGKFASVVIDAPPAACPGVCQCGACLAVVLAPENHGFS
jgi:hypothetical protein